ncbi:REP-associated tyrosine transposase [Pontibacter anaerobius]|uniref:Transposase n=1 Tax=Pontibacter anaerobius TaxID=2993940 RepID=A0ABT3RB94_9BACT|nr:transposase [Pontibacter anaerobius]MCX2738711.1 transposase [Pontibacter anaerobius]
MSTKYKLSNPDSIFFITLTVVEWADAFTRRDYCELVCESIHFCQQKKGLNLYGWCIMTNHVHLICSAPRLPDVLRDLKKYTSRHLVEAIKANPKESRKYWLLWMFKSAAAKSSSHGDYQFWQLAGHQIELSTNQMLEQRLEYLHQNSVKAGFVEEPEQWYYSSARDYAEEKGRLEVILIE